MNVLPGYMSWAHKPLWAVSNFHKLQLLHGYKLTIDTNVIEFKWYAEQLRTINHSYVPPTCKSVCIYPSHFKFNTLGVLQLGCHGNL